MNNALVTARTGTKYLVGLLAGLLVMTPLAAFGADNQVAATAKDGNWDALRVLLKQHADVNAPEPDGSTALLWAVRADNLATADLLIKAGANVKAQNRYGVSPLWQAATNGNLNIVDLLLKAGADPNAALSKGETVLMAAARTGNPGVVKLLLARGAKVNVKDSTAKGETALMRAAAENHADAVRMLIEFGADKNLRSNIETPEPLTWETDGMIQTILPRGGWTPLMFAARQNSIESAKALVEGGADMNLIDPDGTTALVFAIYNAHYDLAAMLLEKGADPNIADKTGMAALYMAVDMNTLAPLNYRPLPRNDGKLNAVDIVKLLLSKGANPNAQLKAPVIGRYLNRGDLSLARGTTPFIRAVKTNDLPVMRILLDAGANPRLPQSNGTTALMIAASGSANRRAVDGPYRGLTEDGAIETIKLCIEEGVDLKAFNLDGQTALHIAAGRGADKIVKFLVDEGADLTARDRFNRSPADMARGVGQTGRLPDDDPRYVTRHPTTIKLLLELMGDGLHPAAKVQ